MVVGYCSKSLLKSQEGSYESPFRDRHDAKCTTCLAGGTSRYFVDQGFRQRAGSETEADVNGKDDGPGVQFLKA